MRKQIPESAQYKEGGKGKKERKEKKEEKWDKSEELKNRKYINHYDHCQFNKLPNYKTKIVILNKKIKNQKSKSRAGGGGEAPRGWVRERVQTQPFGLESSFLSRTLHNIFKKWNINIWVYF